MALGNTEKNSMYGLVFGLVSALGFSIFSVSLRWKKETPKFTTVAIAGLFCFLFSTVIILNYDLKFLSSGKNEGLFALHGTIVCLGLILYSIGSKNNSSRRINSVIFNRNNRRYFLGLVTMVRNKRNSFYQHNNWWFFYFYSNFLL